MIQINIKGWIECQTERLLEILIRFSKAPIIVDIKKYMRMISIVLFKQPRYSKIK